MAISAARCLQASEPFILGCVKFKTAGNIKRRNLCQNYLHPYWLLFGSILKFSVCSLAAIAANLGLTGALANIIGGIIGVVLFTYLGGFIQVWLTRHFPYYFSRKFSRTSRFLVRVKQRFGLGGVAAFTPIILSIPVGVLFALSLTHDKKKIMLSMIISVLFWGVVLFLPYFLFNVNVVTAIANTVE